MRTIVMAGMLVMWAAVASAQTQAGQPFTATFTHDAVNTTGYRVYVDGQKSGADVPLTARDAKGLVTVQVAGQAQGNHSLQVSAFGPGGESQKTAALAFSADVPVPTTPSNLQIVLSIAVKSDGTAELLAFNVRKE